MDLFLTNLPTEEFFQTTETFGLRTEDLDFISNWRPATSSSHLFETCCAFLDVLGSAFWRSFAGFAYVLQFFAGLSGVFSLLRSFLAGKKRRSVFLGTVSLKSFHDEVHKSACASFIVVASYLRTSASQPVHVHTSDEKCRVGRSSLRFVQTCPSGECLGKGSGSFKRNWKDSQLPRHIFNWLSDWKNALTSSRHQLFFGATSDAPCIFPGFKRRKPKNGCAKSSGGETLNLPGNTGRHSFYFHPTIGWEFQSFHQSL